MVCGSMYQMWVSAAQQTNNHGTRSREQRALGRPHLHGLCPQATVHPRLPGDCGWAGAWFRGRGRLEALPQVRESPIAMPGEPHLGASPPPPPIPAVSSESLPYFGMGCMDVGNCGVRAVLPQSTAFSCPGHGRHRWTPTSPSGRLRSRGRPTRPRNKGQDRRDICRFRRARAMYISVES
jgi:hypothetical protein